MWMMPLLHLHVNRKSDYDYDDMMLGCLLGQTSIELKYEDKMSCSKVGFEPTTTWSQK